MKQLFICFYSYSFKSALQKRSNAFVLRIKEFGIAILDIGHKFLNAVVCVLTNEQMEMIGHEARSKDGNEIIGIAVEFCGHYFSCCNWEREVGRKRHGKMSVAVIPKGIRHALVLAFIRKDSSALYTSIENMVKLIVGKNYGSFGRHNSILTGLISKIKRMFEAV